MLARGSTTTTSQKTKEEGFQSRLLYVSREKHGVPAGVISTIQSMEFEFGGFTGDSAVVSVTTTLTDDCPCSAVFFQTSCDGDEKFDLHNVADAQASTANSLKGRGWKRGKGLQIGQRNSKAIQRVEFLWRLSESHCDHGGRDRPITRFISPAFLHLTILKFKT